jgi:hypothetical protein
MKMFIALILSCLSTLGADTDLKVITSTKTDAEKALVFTQDVFLRAGQTNLVRTTLSKEGSLEMRTQRFYHEGVLLAELSKTQKDFLLTTEAGAPYSVSFDFWPSNELKSVAVWSKNGKIIDAFNCSNGICSPVQSSVIQKAGAR